MVSFHNTASKEDLVPPVPVLTRYKKEAGIKAFVKKELFDARVPEPDETRPSEISVLTTPTLCVQLNTLYVSSNKVESYLAYFHFCFGSYDISLFFISTDLSELQFLDYFIVFKVSFLFLILAFVH